MDIPAPILLVEDDLTQQQLLKTLVSRRLDMRSQTASNGREALDILKQDESQRSVKVVVMDLNMPVMGGMETLEIIRAKYKNLPVIVLTGSGDMNDAVQAMKLGAIDFVAKPFRSDQIVVSIRNAMKISLLSKNVKRPKVDMKPSFSFENLIGHDGGLSDIVKMGEKAAMSYIPVLITGETGVGKEVFAKAIHGDSPRRDKPFIAINCGAIPSQLVESTLFGHEKGAFTGAIEKSIGKFREAEGGTIFLDEVGELPLEAQVKLLRVLQQKEVEPVGAGRSVSIDVRVISATNRDLQEEVRQARFREDLYFRLNVLELTVPPLRQRKEDIMKLSAHFIMREAALHDHMPRELSLASKQRLQNYDWPGNVRQLENTIHRAMVLSDGEYIDIPVLGDEADVKMPENVNTHDFKASAVQSFGLDGEGRAYSIYREDGSLKTIEQVENDMLILALNHTDQNVTKAAKILGLAKSTFYRKLSQIGQR